jgi:hypothetical protein
MVESATPDATMRFVDVRPVPTDEEVAAVVAAVEALWTRAVVVPSEPRERPNVWRFSGRWWSRPVPARRDRPYR